MRTLPIVEANPSVAWLESAPREGHEPLRAELTKLPFIIGRNENCDLPIESNRISREHVRIEMVDGMYTARDLGSTNGTFVNGVKTKESPLTDGDLLTVANVGLIFHLPKGTARSQATQCFTTHNDPPPQAKESPFRLVEAVRALQELSLHRGARNRLQAIVRMEDSETLGYELGPEAFDGASPRSDVRLPDSLDCRALRRAGELTRAIAVEQAWNLFGDVLMFLPASVGEFTSTELFDSLERLKQRPTGEARLVLQIPAKAAGDAAEFSDVYCQLKEVGVAAAIDRFSGSAAELTALRANPPEYVKLAASVVQSLGRSAEQRRKLQALLQAAHDMGTQVIACGVSTEEEWLACKSVGVPLAQGDFAAAAMPLDACAGRSAKPIEKRSESHPTGKRGRK